MLKSTLKRFNTGSRNATNCFGDEHTPHAYTPHMPSPLTTYVTPGAPSKPRKSLARQVSDVGSAEYLTIQSMDNDVQKKLDRVVNLPPHNLGSRTRQRLASQTYQGDCSVSDVLNDR